MSFHPVCSGFLKNFLSTFKSEALLFLFVYRLFLTGFVIRVMMTSQNEPGSLSSLLFCTNSSLFSWLARTGLACVQSYSRTLATSSMFWALFSTLSAVVSGILLLPLLLQADFPVSSCSLWASTWAALCVNPAEGISLADGGSPWAPPTSFWSSLPAALLVLFWAPAASSLLPSPALWPPCLSLSWLPAARGVENGTHSHRLSVHRCLEVLRNSPERLVWRGCCSEAMSCSGCLWRKC